LLRQSKRPWLSGSLSAALTLTLLAVLSLACNFGVRPTPASREWTIEEGFESGLGDWERGADVPQDGDRPNQTVEWSIERSNEQAKGGRASARFFLDGKHDDGTIWLTRSFEVSANQEYAARITLDLWSPSESFNTLAKVAAYTGPRQPMEEGDLNTSQPADQAAGWKRYEYQMNTRSDGQGRLWVAFGISVVWETKVTYFIDDVRIEIKPS
jgi:hypothetical protein